MKATDPVDAARVELLLGKLRLPTIKLMWADLATRADNEGWPAARYLAALAEQEVTERARRRIERHLTDTRLPAGKTLDTFDFDAIPTISKAQVMALAGDGWLASACANPGLIVRCRSIPSSISPIVIVHTNRSVETIAANQATTFGKRFRFRSSERTSVSIRYIRRGLAPTTPHPFERPVASGHREQMICRLDSAVLSKNVAAK
jgi:hypothetical protein